MDVTIDILFRHLVFGTGLSLDPQSISSRIVRLDDTKSEAQKKVFVAHSDSWEAMGTKVFPVRRSPTGILDNAEKLIQHAMVVMRESFKLSSPIIVIYYIVSAYEEARTASVVVLLTQ
ncbi:hypothetical protein NW768_001234 [Fusarium equiseti]|uniref:Peptide hydrolase n=1 Tax=Fusarium equiseti TaxID=61235 RepID=A0ABQ8RPW5_FUSEQ|nr:hypothetical protein NW768_001234 [Fusarium equiseti]